MINFNIFFSSHSPLRPHNFLRLQTPNVTEAIIQMLNNCINVILDSSNADKQYVCGTIFPEHAQLQFLNPWKGDVTLEECVFTLFLPLNIFLYFFLLFTFSTTSCLPASPSSLSRENSNDDDNKK
jgi:hypothetical protein